MSELEALKKITIEENDGETQFKAGMEKNWETDLPCERRAIQAIGEFNGWLERFDVFQVKEICQSLAVSLFNFENPDYFKNLLKDTRKEP